MEERGAYNVREGKISRQAGASRLGPLITLRRTMFPSSELSWNRWLVAKRYCLFAATVGERAGLINRAAHVARSIRIGSKHTASGSSAIPRCH